MKITHVCLCGPVTDNWTYQDNLLPKYHKVNGNEVSVITSQYIWNDSGNLDMDKRKLYYNEYGIKTIRIENKFNTNINSKLKIYNDLYYTIINEKPDVLFIHGIQFLDVLTIVRYLRKHPEVTVYIDNHADYSNSAQNWFSENILHKLIWTFCGKLIEPYTKKFYGVLPARVNFLKEVYKLPDKKIELLVLGADDEKVNAAKANIEKLNIREKLQINSSDFLIVSGGKIDSAKKQILLLMEAVNRIRDINVKLVVFGSVSPEIKEEFNLLVDNVKIKYIGWISPDETYQYFASADLAVFPGRHSVIWEQVVGIGIPCIFKHWEGTTHVDVGGNCQFIYEDSLSEIQDKIEEIINNPKLYNSMKNSAELLGMDNFSYSKIAEKSIQ
ncbi:glycosyltransferase family 4 protein [Bacillus sp. RO2]|uniref:glycosyltransferase family 4 protein n=1 Tax=Bacillus sp. RO2 TaxID=2723913 RepID=UPI00145D35CB|nr:glycosyltransferase family 4 protein [Bacillus sp. RO2]NMH73905.1 glycosyltransferase family 4 protein [Bacillus sp. RO2]